MIVSILETIDHDWALVNGGLFLCSDARAIAQHVEARLRLFLGEWFLDLREGVPYFQRVLVKNPDMPVVRSLLTKVVTDTPGVVEVTDGTFTWDPAERILYWAISFMTDAGQTVTVENSSVLGDV